MAWKMGVDGVLMMIMTIFLATSMATANDQARVPADRSQLNAWFQDNVKPFAQRKATLDPALVSAEERVTVVKVRQDGSGQFKTIMSAVNSIPDGNSRRVIVHIGPGVYNEKVRVTRTKPFVTLHGDPANMPTVLYNGDAAHFGTVDSATLIAESDYFVGANLIVKNSSPKPTGKPGQQASALRVSGDKSAFYNCRLLGFQDTLCDDKGRHFFKGCYIEGTVDFIFGNGKSIYMSTHINVIPDSQTFIVAQARDNNKQDTGYSFVHCDITGTGTGAYLARPWRAYSRVVYLYTNMGRVVNPEGWSDKNDRSYDNTVFFGEYKNLGQGASTTKRVKYAKQQSDAQATPFISLGYIQASKWLLPPPKV